MSKIPKIIHYCWFGDAPIPELAKACIQSWKKHLPDYELKFWNNEHIEFFSENQYVREAFQAKKYAFVTDYVRLYVLHQYGGIYLDTDVECKKNLDEFLDLEFFTSFEDYYDSVKPITALMAACKGNPMIADLLSCYDQKSFINADGSFDLTPNTILISDYFGSRFNLLPPYDASGFYYLTEKQVIFPVYYFCQDE
jgi:mannosyltransferase OCH1-like enzyme